MKIIKIYCNVCSIYRKVKNPKMSYIKKQQQKTMFAINIGNVKTLKHHIFKTKY